MNWSTFLADVYVMKQTELLVQQDKLPLLTYAGKSHAVSSTIIFSSLF